MKRAQTPGVSEYGGWVKGAKSSKLLGAVVVLFAWAASSPGQWIYFGNFVRHADGQFCRHQPPEASFTVFLNGDQSRILLESAPSWDTGGDRNIDGKGTFGVELGNFSPAGAVGD